MLVGHFRGKEVNQEEWVTVERKNQVNEGWVVRDGLGSDQRRKMVRWKQN